MMNVRVKNIIQLFAIVLTAAFVVVVARQVFAWTNPGGAPPFASSVISTLGNNVGVGTTNPNSKLEVFAPTVGSNVGDTVEVQRLNSSNGNNNYLDVRNVRTAAGTDWTTAGTRIQEKVDATWMGYIQFNGDNNNGGISFGAGLTTTAPGNVGERMRITSAGNVGVGVASPDSNYKITTSGGGIKAETNTAQPAGYFNNTGGGTAITVGTGGINLGGVTQTSWPAGSWTISGSNTYNSNTGNIGVGTASPAYKLDVGLGATTWSAWNSWGPEIAANSYTGPGIQKINSRASVSAAIAAKNPGTSFGLYMIPWDGSSTLEANCNAQINASWHAQGAVKGNFYGQAFDNTDFTRYSSIVLSQAEFDANKANGTQWWIGCSTLASFSQSLTSSQWTTSGANVYYNSGNVGIGATGPVSQLSVGGNGLANTAIYGNSAVTGVYGKGDAGYGVFGYTVSGTGVNGQSSTYRGVTGDSNTGTGGYFTSGSGYALITGNGNVGIGNPNPGYKLDVNGDANATRLCIAGSCQSSWPVATATSWPAVTNKSLGDVARSDSTLDIGVSQYMRWKNYGNSHVIIDASNSTAPSGAVINNTNSQVPWTGTYPTLMGWNGANTYGVRVDSARVADSATDSTKVAKTGDNMSGNLTFLTPGLGLLGTYDPTKTQAIWAMSPSYVLPADGSNTGNLYGIGWSYEPNYGGAGNNPQSKAGLGFQMLLMNNGSTQTAIGSGIWTNGQVNAAGGLCMNGDCKSTWAPYGQVYTSVSVAPADWFTGVLNPACVQYNNGGLYYGCSATATASIPAGRSYSCSLVGSEFDDMYAPTFGVNNTLQRPTCRVNGNQVTASMFFMSTTPDRYDTVFCQMNCVVY